MNTLERVPPDDTENTGNAIATHVIMEPLDLIICSRLSRQYIEMTCMYDL